MGTTFSERVGRELSLPVYLYEEAQADKSRSNLSVIRAGEYEGFLKRSLNSNLILARRYLMQNVALLLLVQEIFW
jgi:glutamate formiminotransferase